MKTARPRGRPRTGVREAVIAAARQLLAESGAARLTTKAVAVRAGVAESSVFYHFGDRLGLLQAVIQEHLSPLKQLLAVPTGSAGGDLRGEVIGLLTALEDFFTAAVPVMAAIESDVDLRAVYRQRSRDLDLGPHRAVSAVFTRLSDSAPTTADLPTAALLMVGAAHQRALQRAFSPPDAVAALPTTEAIADAVLQTLTR